MFVFVKDVYNLILMCYKAFTVRVIASDFIRDQERESQDREGRTSGVVAMNTNKSSCGDPSELKSRRKLMSKC